MEYSFQDELELLINKHSMENNSNTPDFILAQYMNGCLELFNIATQQRETWYGRDPRPSLSQLQDSADCPYNHERFEGSWSLFNFCPHCGEEVNR